MTATATTKTIDIENRVAIEIIFDNGGGITIQTDCFTHNYDDAAQAANDAQAILGGDSTEGWEGNEPQMWIDTSSAEADLNFWPKVKNGGYIYWDIDDIQSEIESTEPIAESWRNVRDFLVALTGRKIKDSE